MKKKVISLALAAVLLAGAAISGTMAYFTDRDNQKNTFTVGGVTIVQNETGKNNQPFKQNQVLMPMPGNEVNDYTRSLFIDKNVTVKNDGKSDAYVRTFIAIPKELDKNNTLHWTRRDDTNDYWYWDATYDNAAAGRAGSNTAFELTVNNIVYNVYCATYKTVLKTDATTKESLTGVFLDKSVNMETLSNDTLNYFYMLDGTTKVNLGDLNKNGKLNVLVASQACQAAGFADAYDAMKEVFGAPAAQTAKDLGWN